MWLFVGLALKRPRVADLPIEFTGEGQMQLNSLHVAEVLSDDSNFRQRAMDKLAGPLAHVLLLTPQEFASAWLAGMYATALLLEKCLQTPSTITTFSLRAQ